MFDKLVKAGKYLGQAARQMVGVLTHPDEEPMSYEEFYRNRVEARYGGKNGMSTC